ncbi:DUF5082 domain-containing protein [Pseudalkalibacillus decolorationis]|uniref:DUF5082 domain-containing protein n=1 Tax=Pseudalkalibacillus decolorationis TaxID=163879 RepID=UPI0021480838|nr:DUF5082 domain-containing protein [Pseudalkalibacillus decolorationis]
MSYLTYLQSEVREKREQLERLNNCEAELENLQSEFIQKRSLTKDPELTSTTWKGNLANKFLQVREDVTYAYKDISQVQLDTALNTIENKIQEIRGQIESLHRSIASEKARIEREEREERAD